MKVGHCKNKTNKFTDAPENTKDPWTVKRSKGEGRTHGFTSKPRQWTPRKETRPSPQGRYHTQDNLRHPGLHPDIQKKNLEKIIVSLSLDPGINEKIKHDLAEGQTCAKRPRNSRAN